MENAIYFEQKNSSTRKNFNRGVNKFYQSMTFLNCLDTNNSTLKIANNIKKIRQEKGISQDRLLKLANLSLNTVVNVESEVNPNPTIETLSKIATALGVGVGVDNLIKR